MSRAKSAIKRMRPVACGSLSAGRAAADSARNRTIATPEARRAAQDVAATNPAFFVTCLRAAQVGYLSQIPWWPAFLECRPAQAAALKAEAAKHGITV